MANLGQSRRSGLSLRGFPDAGDESGWFAHELGSGRNGRVAPPCRRWIHLCTRLAGLRRLGRPSSGPPGDRTVCRKRGGLRRGWVCGLGHLQPEQGRDIAAVEHLGWRCLGQGYIASGAGEQLVFVHAAQHEEELRLIVEPGTDPIQCRRDMLAHVRPVRAAAGELDLARRRKQAVALAADPVHHALRQSALQQLDQGIDRSCAIPADGFPSRCLDRRDRDLDP